jgi:hypothetical protein
VIRRIRPRYSAAELKEMYDHRYDHRCWPDHVTRVAATIEVGRRVFDGGVVADLSCGDGAIATGIAGEDATVLLGDLVPGWPITGRIETTWRKLPPVDLYVMTETLEHLDLPLLTLRRIRRKARRLLLSTPVAPAWDDNPEHYWAWDRAGVEELLAEADWVPVEYEQICPSPHVYTFGIWGCR